MSQPPTGDARSGDQWIASVADRIGRREAELLLAFCWRLTRTQFLTHSAEAVPADVAARFSEAVARRVDGVPAAYLLGRREFWSLDFTVTPAVLVPRPETELLVQRTLDLVTAREAEIADLGTGSGAIAISLAHERPGWSVTATDLSADALAVARANAERLVNGRVTWRQGDWYGALQGQRFDALVSNPPYIGADDPVLQGDGLRHEPRGALTPGGDGYSAYTTLIDGAAAHLKPGGCLLVEHGTSQGERLRAMLVARGFVSVTSHRDLAGHERVTEGKLAA
jgi:release factor glutamine methyltransferase